MKIKLLILAVIALFFVASCGNDKSAVPTKSLATTQNLGLTVEQFTAAYNGIAPNHKIGTLEFVRGDVKDAGKFSFSDHLHFLCSIDKSGKLLEVAMISEPEKLGEIITMLDFCRAVIKICNPELSDEHIKFLMRNLLLTRDELNTLEGKNISVIEGNVRYTIRKDVNKPFLFMASAKDL